MNLWLKKWLPRILLGLAAIVPLWCLGRAAWMFGVYDWKTVTFPFPVDYGEGPILDQVMRLARFQNIYGTNLTHLPFTISNYPPMYLAAQVPFAWIAGAAYWYGRGLSALSVIATAVFITLIIQTISKDWLAGILGGLVLFSIPYILHWSPFCRVDAFALGLSMAALFVVVRWPQQFKGLLWSSILLTAAIFTRQSYALAAPLAAFIWLLSIKPRRRAFLYAGLVGGLCLALFLLLNLATRGGFYFNIITANVNEFHWNTVSDYAKAIWDHMPYFVVSSVIFILGAVWLKNKTWWLVAPYLLGGTLSALTIGKAGSNVNYLFEFAAGLSLVAGALIAAAGRLWWIKIPLILALAWQVNNYYDWTQNDYYQWVMHRVDVERGDIARLQEIVQQANGPVLADEFMGLVPLAGKQLYFQPFEFKQLSLAGVWDQQPFLEDLSNKKFAMILLYDPPTWDSRRERWTYEQLSTIEWNYRMTGFAASTRIYQPKMP